MYATKYEDKSKQKQPLKQLLHLFFLFLSYPTSHQRTNRTKRENKRRQFPFGCNCRLGLSLHVYSAQRADFPAAAAVVVQSGINDIYCIGWLVGGASLVMNSDSEKIS